MYLELRILRTRRDLYLSSTVNNTVSNISYLDTEFIFCLFKDKTTLRWFVVCNVPWLITCLKYQQDIKTEVSHTLWKCFKQNINICIFESKLWCSTVINIRILDHICLLHHKYTSMHTSQLPGLCEEGSCSSTDVSVGQSFSRAPPQSHRLSTRYTTCLCSWKCNNADKAY